ncbi:hypothetical protein [Rhizobium sp. TRM95796]|uniref:hypothetical protein n=1 Tax=Rhizobium sp. TRM95796 TaxID=2979862 RepID=UPI0021E790D7|nr:hypothetical protein [Rhizobium sp. TRM95796]MCV3769102.1 hypothetical protein [Rhizobium sp. TRM95796]
MLVARAQLNFVRELVARFERHHSTMQPIGLYQAQYVAIVALLRSIGHVFTNVDCSSAERKAWNRSKWQEWKRSPVFDEFIEPTRNALLKGWRRLNGLFAPT